MLLILFQLFPNLLLIQMTYVFCLDYVLKRFPNSSRSEITLAINMKCKEARVAAGRADSGGKCRKTMVRFPKYNLFIPSCVIVVMSIFYST